LALGLALSPPFQAVATAAVRLPLNSLLTKTGLYNFWLATRLSFRAKQLRWDTEAKVYKMRKKIKDVRLDAAMERWKEENKKKKEQRREEEKRAKQRGTDKGGSSAPQIRQRGGGPQIGLGVAAPPAQGSGTVAAAARVKQQSQAGQKGALHRLWASVTGSRGARKEVSPTSTEDDLGKPASQPV